MGKAFSLRGLSFFCAWQYMLIVRPVGVCHPLCALRHAPCVFALFAFARGKVLGVLFIFGPYLRRSGIMSRDQMVKNKDLPPDDFDLAKPLDRAETLR